MKPLVIALCSLLFSGVALACDTAVLPDGQTPVSFYTTTNYGVLGVSDQGFIRILDKYRCYDLSSLRNKNLAIYFNNKSSDQTDPTYVGALIVRTFQGTSVDGPFSAYHFRSTTVAGNSNWVRSPSEPGNTALPSDISVLSGAYEPEEPIRGSDFSSLDRQLRLGASESDQRLREWHAKVSKMQDEKYLILRDSAASDKQWSLDTKFNGKDGGYLIARNYLIKYQPTTNPKREVYFTSGATGADCVYIKLIAPGDGITLFAIERSGSAFFSLKMKADANCVAP